MSTQAERSAATRAKFLAVARKAFVRDGYERASLDAIAMEAGLTKGALYHHFEGKDALFAAVFSEVSADTVARAGRRMGRGGAPRARLKAAALAWLKAVERSEARVILLELGPQALGLARMRALEDAIALPPVLALVKAVMAGEPLKDPLDAALAARLINAALSEIALLRHGTGGRTPTTAEAARAIAGIVDGILARA